MATNQDGWLTRVRRSPVYRVVSILPTPARPWLMAFETLTALRLAFSESKHLRKEARLEQQLARALGRRGGGLRGMILGAGLGYVAKRLLESKSADQQRLRVSGFVNEALDRVQATVGDGFTRARTAVRGEADRQER